MLYNQPRYEALLADAQETTRLSGAKISKGDYIPK